ncbi:MAG: hypothetical protein L3J93_02855, partial [Thermoplasmata archaeon]|nr:hypothetical protein [Thermoplasmata archaeon]
MSSTESEVVAFLDDDDLFMPGKLARMQELFSGDSRLGFYHHGMRFFAGPGPPTVGVAPPRDFGFAVGIRRLELLRREERTPSKVRRLWYTGAAYNMSSMVVRRALLTPVL